MEGRIMAALHMSRQFCPRSSLQHLAVVDNKPGHDKMHQWISMDINGYQWISMDINGYQWISMVSCAGGPNSPCSDFWEGQPYFLGHVRTLSVIKPACGVESQVGQCDLFKEMRFRGFRAFRIHLMH